MNKLESAKIIVEQEGGCNRLKCEECIIQTVYRTGSIEECEEKLDRDITLAIAKQYIADHEQEQEAKPEHKPCDWDDGWEPEKPEHKMCQNCGHKYVGDKCSRCWHDNMTGMADKSCKKPEHKPCPICKSKMDMEKIDNATYFLQCSNTDCIIKTTLNYSNAGLWVYWDSFYTQHLDG